MDNIQLTKEELDYINESAFDSTNDVYAYAKYHNMPKCLPNRYTIKCNKLPVGTYNLRYKNIDFHFNTKYAMAYGDLHNTLRETYENWGDFSFRVLGACDVMLQVKKCKSNNIETIVKELRKQAILNIRKLEQEKESLIQKDIKKHTYLAIDPIGHQSNLGEGYNRASLTATAEECLDEDITIEIDESKPMDDLDVRYLRAMKLKQDRKRLDAKQRALDEEKQVLKLREDEFMKY